MIQTGLFPLTGVLVGLTLYGLYVWVLRLKCRSRWAQAYIAVSMVLMLLFSTLTLTRTVYVVESADACATGGQQGENVRQIPSSTTDGGYARGTSTDRQSEPDFRWEVAEAAQPEHQPSRAGERTAMLFSDSSHLLGSIYLAGVGCVLLYFAGQLLWLLSLLRRYRRHTVAGTHIYETDLQQPFSFGRNIFISRQMDTDVRRYVLLHERSHIRHRHFLKLCALQLLVALCWYNPFAWLLFSEMRLQQELEVDNDVVSSGVDREHYQLSLLRVCVQEGKWILLRSTFGLKPLKQRIIFMNKQLNTKNMRNRQLVASACLVLVAMTAAAMSCQTREKTTVDHATTAERTHPMKGCWTMDWISNTGSGEEVHPVAMHYGFYNDSTFLCFSYWRRKGVNMMFSISGEGYSWRGDTLVCADGRPTDYTFPDERTAISRWMKDSTQRAGVQGPDITEQWSRIAPNEDIVSVFRAVLSAKPCAERPMDGVWQREGDKRQQADYILINDTIFMAVNVNPSTVTSGFRYAGSGLSCTLDHVKDALTQTDRDHLQSQMDDRHPAALFRRVPLPDYLRRAFSPATLN